MAVYNAELKLPDHCYIRTIRIASQIIEIVFIKNHSSESHLQRGIGYKQLITYRIDSPGCLCRVGDEKMSGRKFFTLLNTKILSKFEPKF
jgi:hypothetical protein